MAVILMMMTMTIPTSVIITIKKLMMQIVGIILMMIMNNNSTSNRNNNSHDCYQYHASPEESIHIFYIFLSVRRRDDVNIRIPSFTLSQTQNGNK